MRSFTAPDLPGRCLRCWVKLEHCICAELEPAPNRTEVVIVRHHWEARKSTGTARIAELVLERCTIVEVGYDASLTDRELSPNSDGWLLYPDAPGVRLPEGTASRLFVLDGTWAQTRRMLRRLPSLCELPRVSLPAAARAELNLRKAHLEGGRSTIEAVADALELLEGTGVADPVRKAARLHLEGVLRARGKKRR